jgi:hypothetical protein
VSLQNAVLFGPLCLLCRSDVVNSLFTEDCSLLTLGKAPV